MSSLEYKVDSEVKTFVHPIGCDFIWGLKHLVQAVSPSQLWHYRWFISQMTPKPSDLLSVPSGYSVRMMKHLDFYAFDFVA